MYENNYRSNQEPSDENYSNPYGNNYASYEIAGNRPVLEKEKKKGKKGGLLKRVLVNAALGILFGVCAGVGLYAVNTITNKSEVQSTSIVPSAGIAGSGENSATTAPNADGANATTANNIKTVVSDVSGVVDEVMPSLVSITNIFTESANLFGQESTFENESGGSGIIIGQNDEELLIVTNNHVVANAQSLSVQFIDDTSVEARPKGTDSDTDLAIIAVPLTNISAETLAKVKVAILGNSDDLKVGEPAIAIGNALGYGQSVTTGVISALGREVTVDDITNELIQTDAAINPGNSGGALLNINGEVIGINAVKFASNQVEGMGYAIPISSVTNIIDDLMNKTTKYRVDEDDSSYIGITGQNVTPEIATFGIPVGAYVTYVDENGAAATAGINVGDVISAFDGEKINSMEELKEILQYYAAGTTVEVTVQRGDKGGYTEMIFNVTLGKKVNTSASQSEPQSGQTNEQQEELPDSGDEIPYDGSQGLPSMDDQMEEFFRDFFGR